VSWYLSLFLKNIPQNDHATRQIHLTPFHMCNFHLSFSGNFNFAREKRLIFNSTTGPSKPGDTPPVAPAEGAPEAIASAAEAPLAPDLAQKVAGTHNEAAEVLKERGTPWINPINEARSKRLGLKLVEDSGNPGNVWFVFNETGMVDELTVFPEIQLERQLEDMLNRIRIVQEPRELDAATVEAFEDAAPWVSFTTKKLLTGLGLKLREDERHPGCKWFVVRGDRIIGSVGVWPDTVFNQLLTEAMDRIEDFSDPTLQWIDNSSRKLINVLGFSIVQKQGGARPVFSILERNREVKTFSPQPEDSSAVQNGKLHQVLRELYQKLNKRK